MKRIISLVCALSLIMSSGAFAEPIEQEAAQLIYYVSPLGNDDNKGTIDSPLQTIEEAQTRVRANKKLGKEKIEVIIREGEYRFTKSLNLNELDTASEKAPVVYKAMDGEEVVFKGSKTFSGKSLSPVTDPAILARIKSSAKNKIVKIDLAAEGFTMDQLRDNSEFGVRIHPMQNDDEANMLYIDNIEQTLSQWPNGKGAYATYDKAVDSFTINYTDSEPSRWTTAKDWWVGGYLDWDWRYSRGSGVKIDPEKKTLTISSLTSGIGFTSYQSKRWKAFNLLEEVDIPGEFYIDRENMNLYLYPPYSLKDATFELSVMKTPFIEAKNAGHIKFEGIKFCQSRGYGVRMTDVVDIDFTGCTFTDIQIDAIYIKGTKTAITDSTYWQVTQIDASYDCDIRDNIFYNLGGAAIDMAGGNVDTLRKANNNFENNFVSKVAQVVEYRNCITARGCGINVRNNNISRAPSSGIYYTANDCNFEYNEIYNIIQGHDDAGTIYCGRNALQQGSVIAYNYIHHWYSTDILPFGHQCGIYWDDSMAGQTAKNNIFIGGKKDHYTNGIGNVFKDNLSMDIQTGVLDVKNGGIARNTTDNSTTGFGSIIADEELYFSRYPMLKTVFEMIKDGMPAELAKFSTYTNNLAVNSAPNIMGTNMLTYGNVSNNVSLESCDDFVDPEAQDFRLKSGSKTAQMFPTLLDDTFDIELIGMKSEAPFNEENNKFRQLYPQNGAVAVSTNKLDFKWEESFGATKYRLVVATDRDLKNVVYDDISYYNVKRVDGLLPGNTYYWKVYAENASREFASKWESKSPVFTFRTAIYETLDTDNFNAILNNVQREADNIKEGNETGDYLPGTVESFNQLVKKSVIAVNARLGLFKQESLDALATRLGSYFSRAGLVNKGFVDLGKATQNGGVWSSNGAILTVKDDMVTYESDPKSTAGTSMMGLKGYDRMTGSVIYSFTGNLKVGPNKFIDMGISKEITSPPWTASNPGYSLVIKQNVIELQYATGTEGGILKTYDYTMDEGEHQFEFGFIDIGVGNAIIFKVDGETVIEFRDVLTNGINSLCNFCILLYNQGGTSVTIKPTKSLGTKEDFAEIEKINTYRSAKDLIDGFDSTYTEGRSKFVVLKDGGGKILTEEKAVDISESPSRMKNDKMYVPANKVKDFLPATVVNQGTTLTATTEDGQTATVAVSKDENGVDVICLSDLLAELSINYVYDGNSRVFVIGDLIIMNNSKCLLKLSTLVDMLDKYGDKEEVIF